MSLLDRPAVKRVRDALGAAGLDDTVIELEDAARTADDAASAADCPLGAIVKSLVFGIEGRFVMALIAGDRRCVEDRLPRALNMPGNVRRPQASEVKAVTGFTIGGVAPVGLLHRLPTAIDASLKRFETVYAAAGHPHCIFPIAPRELIRITGGIVSHTVAEPGAGAEAYVPHLQRSRTFASEDSE